MLHHAISLIASDLVFFEGLYAGIVVALSAPRWARTATRAWFAQAAVVFAISLVLAAIAERLYYHPTPGLIVRPGKPLPPNDFPSHHTLLATAIAAVVYLGEPRQAKLLVLCALTIDWALIDTGSHTVLDVVMSTLFVAVATGVALWMYPIVVRALAKIDQRDHRGLRGASRRNPSSEDRAEASR